VLQLTPVTTITEPKLSVSFYDLHVETITKYRVNTMI
jgi:hypothetical protein